MAIANDALPGASPVAGDARSAGEAKYADLHREVEGLIEWVVQAARSPKKFLEFERGLIPRVFALGRLFIALYLARREEAICAELPDRLRVGRWWYRRRPRHSRDLGTFFGKVRYPRTYMHLEGEATGAAKGFHPLDRELGLTSDGFSLHLISLAARLATELSFARDPDLVRQVLEQLLSTASAPSPAGDRSC